MNTIVKMKFGSHLYGTNTKDSDTDYKGIFMPTKKQILLGRIPKCYSENTKKGDGKNTSEDIDVETVFSPVWWRIVKHRDRFITKDMQAFVGYAMRQASKYGIKGSRLSSALKVIDFLNDKFGENIAFENNRLTESWDKLPEGEHIYKNGIDPNGNKIYQVCGKKLQETVTLRYLYDVIIKFYNAYGARAKLAEKNEGIDWKAVSHALRASMQLIELYTTGKIIFPLAQAQYLKDVKAGKLDYKKEVAPLLEELIKEVKLKAEQSNYPDKVDRKFWDNFIMEEVGFVFEETSWIIT